jgi:peptidoglycan hydrolase-like protein with peptidoglycan-binding domain
MNDRTLLTLVAGVGLALAAPGSAQAQVTKPAVRWLPAARGNYTPSSRTRITQVVIHKAQGSNAAGWFANPRSSASAHYDVHYDASIYQSVADDDIAWHAGNSAVNRASIGIEHAGYAQRADTSDAMYRASARLVAWICRRYGIPIDRRHIIGHAEVPHPRIPGRFGGANGHWDPGPHWNWTYYMSLVRSYAGQGGAVAAPPPSAGSSQPTLRQGSRGAAVVTLQNALKGHGFDPGPSDGVFGSRTANAVRGFQRARRLVVDGVVGPQTWGALRQRSSTTPVASTPPPASPAPATTTGPTLRQGSRGAAVRRLQGLLRQRGFNPGPIDGIFGSRTTGAVRAFQRARRLVVDGVVGPQTWGALGR